MMNFEMNFVAVQSFFSSFTLHTLYWNIVVEFS